MTWFRLVYLVWSPKLTSRSNLKTSRLDQVRRTEQQTSLDLRCFIYLFILSREFIYLFSLLYILCTIKSHICLRTNLPKEIMMFPDFPLMTTCLLFCTIRRFSSIWKNTLRNMILLVISRYVFVFILNSVSIMKRNWKLSITWLHFINGSSAVNGCRQSPNSW